ncbi:hypothetical protein [Haloarchaeobius sp. HME9146]|uniref:hypothetical protein n=1 Tax=Haloarchaeobius sp. HME9146 TaxID=2978732 RepID=UPI0021BF010C|nr:hypothetical protein [Haloarchaeobius sp. HME9146]MCT9098146.1 hypothetical protein [Haloarchaeobius sp. HME9146]
MAVLFVILVGAGAWVTFTGPGPQVSDSDATIDRTDLSVRLNDEWDLPESANDSVQTCITSGTPGDSIGVYGTVTVTVPVQDGFDRADHDYQVVMTLVDVGETTTKTGDYSGRETVRFFWIVEDDETLAVGETTTVRIRVRDGPEVLAESTQNVVVEEGDQTFDCEDAAIRESDRHSVDV